MKISFLFLLVIIVISSLSLQASEWVIIANSPAQFLEGLNESIQGRKVLAIDGAANRLRERKIIPHAILGDFDSILNREYWGITGTFNEINNSTPPYMGHFGVLIVPAKDQDYTDLEKGIMYCDKQGAEAIIIINATGGRMDHTLASVGNLRKYHKPGRKLILQTDTEIIEFIKNDSTVIEGNIGDYCAVMGYPEASFTSTGLVYGPPNYPLIQGISESVCNRLLSSKAFVVIQGEAIVIKPRQLTLAK